MPAGRTRVAASFWSTPRDRVLAEADRLATAGLTTIHWDRTDGIYARAGGFSPAEAAAVTQHTGLNAEAHLMLEEPLLEVDRWTEFCDLVVVHADSRGWREATERIRSRGRRAAVAVAGGGELPEVDDDTDVLVMSVVPGHAGSPFRTEALRTVREAARSARAVGLDGGVTVDVLPSALQSGASWLVSGSDLVGSPRPGDWLEAAGAL